MHFPYIGWERVIVTTVTALLVLTPRSVGAHPLRGTSPGRRDT